MLAAFTRNLPLTLTILAVLVALVVLGLVLLVRKRRVPAPVAGEGGALPPGEVVVDFRDSGLQPRISAAFQGARQTIRRRLGPGGLYRVPWFLLLGEAAAAKGRTLTGAGLALPLGAPEHSSAETGEGCVFWFFEHGVVLDLAGDCVLRADGRSDAGAWRHFLGLLREKRPERPFDGVVLALPCAELIGPLADEGLIRSRATEKGDALYHRLREAQEQTGMVFPVYVLVTGCQQIPGFAAFVSEVPETLHGGIMGWSNPYALETTFRPEWVDEAFGALSAGLHGAQVDAFGEQPVVEDPDGVFCFPEEMERLREGLRTTLGQLFRSSSYHELLPCRGIYFCGEMETTAPARGGLVFDAPPPVATVFARDVFERKVFPERELARPGSRALTRSTRRLRRLQAAVAALAVVATLGLWWAYHHLQARAQNLSEFFVVAERNIREVGQQRLQGTADRGFQQARLFEVLDSLAQVNGDWFGSVFVPDSWFDSWFRGFNDQLQKAFATTYRVVIFTTLQQELERKFDGLLADAGISRPAQPSPRSGPAHASLEITPSPAAGGELPAGAAPAELEPATRQARQPVMELENLREYTRLRDFVTGLQTLETNVKRYNGLKETRSLEDLDAVVNYLFLKRIPHKIFETSGLYRGALAVPNVYDRIKPADGQPYAVDGAKSLSDWLFARLFAQNPVAIELDRVRSLLEEVTAPDAGHSPGLLAQSLEELRNHLLWAGGDLTEPALAWLSREELVLGTHYDQLLDGIGRSEYLGPEAADDVRKWGADRFRQLRQRLLGMETVSTGPLLQTDPKTKALALSDPAKSLESALNGLVTKGMIAGGDAAAAAGLAPLPHVIWDAQRLQQAAGLYKPQQESLDKILAPFSPDLQASLRKAAWGQLGARMMKEVVEARRPAGEPEGSSPLAMEQALEVEVANFQAAAPSLTELSGSFAKLGRGGDQQSVTAAFAAQGQGILADADRLLLLLAPYTPKGKGFEWWNGARGAALEAFNARDEGELKDYLATQRSALADLSTRYVEPVIQAVGRGLPTSPGLRGQLKRWTALADQLRRNAAKEPGNSVSALEELILKDLSQVEPANCTDRITARMLAEPVADFFQERRADLRRKMSDRCAVLVGGQAVAEYRKLESFFNQRLAGKFPFSKGLPGRPADEADPGDLRDFFRLYDAYAPVVLAADLAPAVSDFVTGMGDVRTFFAAFLDDPLRAPVPAFDIEVRFRENRKEESGGDRILRWSIASGDALAVSHPGAGARAVLPWQAGNPLRLELQWAQDSPVVPVDSPGVRVEGRTAVIERSERWSLLALLRGFGITAAGADPAVQLLRFAVSTKGEPPAEPQPPARVYLGLTVRPPQRADKAAKDQPPVVAPNLEVPAFPVEAPRWTAAAAGNTRPAGGRP